MKKSYDSKFKSKVAIEAIRGEKSMAEISSRYGVHSTQIANWKTQAVHTIEAGFVKLSGKNKDETEEITRDDLLREIGQLKIENEYLKKKYKQLFA